jgi:hypothetical protein
MTVDVTACKVEIEQTQQLLQDFQKAHDKAIAKVYEQLQNLLSGIPQAQWDRVCRQMRLVGWSERSSDQKEASANVDVLPRLT